MGELKSKAYGGSVLITGFLTATVLVGTLFPIFAAEPSPAPQESADLAVQRSMAAAAWWQFGLSLVGTAALLWTLRLSLAANATATTALNQSQDTTRRELRAYLSVEPVGVTSMRGGEPRVIATVLVRNVGRVIANEVKLSVRMTASIDRRPNGLEFADMEDAEAVGVIHPNAVLRRGAARSVEVAEIEALPSAPKFIYVWGTVWYKDGFDQLRETRFCFRYNIASAEGEGKEFRIEPEKARYQEEYNNAT